MSERALRSGKARDAAAALPLFGLLLLMPPVISLLARPQYPFGVPLVVLYLFGVWICLIACTFLLARRLRRLPSADVDTEGGDDTAPR